jgi:hypothetical protein
VVSSNSTPIPFDGTLFAPMRDSTDLLSDPAALRQRLRDDGYLRLRGVLDPADVWRLRGEYFAMFPAGYLKAGTDPGAGVFGGGPPPGLAAYGTAGHPAHEFVRGARFERFVAQPALAALAATLLGDGSPRPAPVRAPRAILRHFDRLSGRSSRAHTDFDYMREGDDSVITMWIPVGDCPLESGGLVYLERSHTLTEERLAALRTVTDRPADGRPLSHDLGWVAHELDRRWLWTDYRAGDVAVHTSRIVHAALDTTTEAMRVSADIRFAASTERLDHRWLRTWSADDGT